ncbi:MAG TPA: peptidase MA family metallohydrolase [Thermomicrobiales bacterium]|nr:peptidase MA family metallohydrolase [Thermomicrobiales bacterium]
MRRFWQSRSVRMLCCLLLALHVVVSVSAEPAGPVSVETRTTPSFPTGITFEATIPVDNDTTIAAASLYYRVADDPTLNQAPVSPTEISDSGDYVTVSRFVDLQTAFVPPGVALAFFWELTSTDATTIVTASESTPWIDSRFNWEVSQSDQISLHTYGMSDDFVGWMLDQAQATLDDLESRYDLEGVGTIEIWVYPNSGDFAGTRQANTRESIAGISYPGSSLILAIVPDGNEREFGRVIPHEISHQALYHTTNNPFAPPPLWFDEGLATHYQIGGTDHYPAMVWRAAQENTLFDIASLNASFPFQPAQATLAYASSWSMVGYIETTYGADGIARVIAAFGEGLPVDDAINEALGVSLEQLNADWHTWVLAQGDPGTDSRPLQHPAVPDDPPSERSHCQQAE